MIALLEPRKNSLLNFRKKLIFIWGLKLKKYYLLLFLYMIILSCFTQNDSIEDDYVRMAREEINYIEQNSSKKDIEENIDKFNSYAKKSGKPIEYFKDDSGSGISGEWIEIKLKEGWQSELNNSVDKLVTGLKNIDEQKLSEYFEQIKTYSKKIGINLLQTLGIILEWAKEKSIEISKTDFL